MNPIILSSFLIPGAVAFCLIALLIRERYNFLPRRQNVTQKVETNKPINQAIQEYRENKLPYAKRYPEDFLDLSGGTMGI